MKKVISILLVCLMMGLAVGCAAAESDTNAEFFYPTRTGVRVEAMFAAPDIQPYTGEDGDQEKLDCIWVFYTDGTFEQFAEADDRIVLFSTGTHQLEENADYIYEHPGEAGNGQITIRRNRKFTSQGITDYDSEHTYDLGTLGFYPVYTPDNPDKQVTAVFYGDDKQPFTKKDGGQDMLDTWWIYFSDGTFVQFAILEDKVVLFSEGVYKLSDGSSFGYEVTPEKDVITIQRTKKYVKDSLREYHSSHDYELSTLGLVRIVSIGQ